MDLDVFQETALSAAIYPSRNTRTLASMTYCALGLAEEAGEVAGKLKKIIRDGEGLITPDGRERMARELGDVLWYVSAMARELGLTLSEVAEMNLAKIRDRVSRGTLRGSGDDR